ncbi:MAG: 3',5'-cyclic-nucleotide phosphodiesterase, partial [Chitinophagaceae bacterium]
MYRVMVALMLLCSSLISAQGIKKPAFKLIPLGIRGGLDESNLSCYMVSPAGSNAFVCLDAGTVRFGIEKAIASRLFKT